MTVVGTKSFVKNEDGAVLFEAALFLFFILVPVFLGLVELSSYIRTKEKVNRVSHEMGELFSSIPDWSVAEMNSLRPAANLIRGWHGMNVSAVFCRGGGDMNPVAGFSDTYPGDAGDGLCGYGNNHQGGNQVDPATCNMSNLPAGASAVSAAQYVVVTANCNYSPMLFLFKFIADGNISATTVAPMRSVVDFNN